MPAEVVCNALHSSHLLHLQATNVRSTKGAFCRVARTHLPHLRERGPMLPFGYGMPRHLRLILVFVWLVLPPVTSCLLSFPPCLSLGVGTWLIAQPGPMRPWAQAPWPLTPARAQWPFGPARTFLRKCPKWLAKCFKMMYFDPPSSDFHSKTLNFINLQ